LSDILIQIVDEIDNAINAASIDEAQLKGLFHRVSRVMVEDDEQNVVIQKRPADMPTYPNCWDCSAAGHVDAGEAYDVAAAREMKEEIGLSGLDLEEVGYYKTLNEQGNRHLKRFNKSYKTVVKRSETVIMPDHDEVVEAKWIAISELKEDIASKPDNYTDGLKEHVARFYQ